ncbi:ATP-binding cassette domain-containing protein, partial [uncultured Sulfitobacter sp.]|uniref:ATP-binding cassette domain-containing protein n=1 Tax=uncultured Sulfitobacter sp. TaxID=191468 RepID=UPI002595AC82
GGQRKRVAIAQVLALSPKLLLMDEPFAALDAIVRTRLSQELLAWVERDHLTVLLVTHDPAEAARLADHILILSAAGAQSWPVPALPAPRPVTAPEVWACQSALLSHLRGVPA